MGRFKNGLCLGGLLGVAIMWLNTTQKGKQMRDEMLDHAAEVYVKLKDVVLKSDQYKKMTKNEYVKMAHDLVNKYAIENGLAENVKKMIEKVVLAQWNNLRGEMKK